MSGKFLFYTALVLVAALILFTIGLVNLQEQASRSGPGTPTATKPVEYCEWNWAWGTTKSIGYADAPRGYTYAVVKVYIKNHADKAVSTYPGRWKFTANGIEYSHDSVTYSEEIDHQAVDVQKGGTFTTEMVYLVRDDIRRASLEYSYWDAPPMKQNVDLLVEL